MKHIIIGDIHGRDCWKQIKIRDYDKIVFLGDYVDSPDLSDFTILENLKNIINLKKRHPDKVILLLGNHDTHYLHYPNCKCSGFRPTMQIQLSGLFRNNPECFQIAYQKDHYLFTHAGVSNAWYKDFSKFIFPDENEALAELLNKIEKTNQRYLIHAVSYIRGGRSDHSGPLWADISETIDDMLEGYHQVAGHNKVPNIQTNGYPGTSITYVDLLISKTLFYELDI